MNDPHSGAKVGNAVDAAHTRAALQQAIDHYPRLVTDWRIFVRTSAGRLEFTTDAFTLAMGACQWARIPNGADDES